MTDCEVAEPHRESYLTRGVTSFALYCILENKSIKSAISSLFLADRPVAVKPPAAEGEAAIIVPRPAVVASSRTRPPSNTAEPCPLEREDRPGHPFPASFFLTARLRGPEPGSLPEFRAPASCSTLRTQPCQPWQPVTHTTAAAATGVSTTGSQASSASLALVGRFH